MTKKQSTKKSDGRYILIIILTILVGVTIGYVYGGFMVIEESRRFVEQTETETTDGGNAFLEENEKSLESDLSSILDPSEISIDDDPQLGPNSEDAIITIVEFSDYECPYCKQFFDESFQELLNTYIENGDVQYVFRDFPLEVHEKAVPAAIAANCAGEQETYWEMHDKLFEHQKEWSSVNSNEQEYFEQYAGELTLNMFEFKQCFEDSMQKQADEILHDQSQGGNYGVKSTPTFFINGEKIVGAQPTTTFKTIIEDELAKERALKVR